MLLFTLDRPRRIDRVIDFFGDQRPAATFRLSMAGGEGVPRMATR
jgi:hypothetical protein